MLGRGLADTAAAPTGWNLSAIRLPVQVLAAAAIVAGLTIAVRLTTGPAPVVLLTTPSPRPTVLDIAPLRLAEPGIDPVTIEPGRIDPRTGHREDVLGRGRFDALEVPVLRLALTRGPGAEQAPSLFVLLARRAAKPPAGGSPLAVLRTGSRGAVETRFGTVEILEAVLAGPATRRCTAFVVRQAGLRLDGYLCAPLGTAPEAGSLACTIDSLDLDDPADPTASATFRSAKASSACDHAGLIASDPAGRTGSITRRRPNTKN